MRALAFLIEEPEDGMQVKQYVRRKLGLSARVLTVQKYTPAGMCINGQRCKSIDVLHRGDLFSLTLPEEEGNYEPVPVPLDILFEDEDFLVIDKPPGMPVHSTTRHGAVSVVNAVAFYFQTQGIQSLFRPVYRLDKDTSGVLVLAKHRIAVSSTVLNKVYYAVCEGQCTGEGVVDLPISLVEGSIIKRRTGLGKPAVTRWRAIRSAKGHTLLAFELETGRTHQIRVHMAAIGHPVAGDDLYGGRQDAITRQALFCKRVHITNQVLSCCTEVETTVPKDIKTAFPNLFQ